MPYLMQAADLQFRLLDQITILVGQQIALDLRHCIDRDVYHDQQTSASQIERYACFRDQELRNQTNQRKISCTDHGDAGQHEIQIFLCILAGTNTRNEAPVPLQIFRSLFRIEHDRSEEHTSELQSLMRISYAVFCLKKKKKTIVHK